MPRARILIFLVVLNLLLQIFDGLATYVGWQQHGEANPLLRAGFEVWGAGPTLLTAKLLASGFILLLAWTPRRTLAALGLAFTASAYTALSLFPWATRLFPSSL